MYFRKGTVRKRLPDNIDSKEFFDAYWMCRSGKAKTESEQKWDALIVSYHQSPEYTRLAPGTRANYRRHCEEIREKNGTKDMRTFRRKHAIEARDKLSGIWSKANERVAVLSTLCRHAVDKEWIDRNPVIDIAKLKGGEYEPWPEIKLQAIERYCDQTQNNLARTAYEVAIGTGQRIGDCCGMTWDDFDREFMSVVQEKTGAKISIYCPLRLREYLSRLPKTGRFIFGRNLTQPISKRAVQKAVDTVRGHWRSGRRTPLGHPRVAIHGSCPACRGRMFRRGDPISHRAQDPAMVQKYRA